MPTLVSIPDPFLRLEAAGNFDYWGAPYRELSEVQREARIKSHIKRVLWWNSIEWDQSSDQIAAFSGDNVLRPGLIPFAGNGHGDSFCWYPAWQDGPEPPVVFVAHDEKYSRLFAQDFSTCLARCFLRNWVDRDEEEEELPFPATEIWDAHFEILRPLLNADLVAKLRESRRQFSAEGWEELDEEIALSLPSRRLIGMQLPVSYDHEYLGKPELLALYDESIAFYRELVEVEGRPEFRKHLQDVIASKASISD